MNKITYAFFLLPTLLFAQPVYEFDVHYGFGASELSYNSFPGVAITIYPFGNFGFSAGIEYSMRWSTKSNAQSGEHPAVDSPYEDQFTFRYSIDRYKEELHGKLLQVPLMMKYSDDFYYTAAGIKIGTVSSVGTDISYSGLKTEGYYPQYNLILTEPEFQGFGVQKDGSSKTKKTSKVMTMLALEGGVKFRINDEFTIQAGAFVDYSFNKGFDKALQPAIQRVETDEGVSLKANDTWKSWQPWSVGAVVKISFMTKRAEPEPQVVEQTKADNYPSLTEPLPPPQPVLPPEPIIHEFVQADTSALPSFLLNREPNFVFYYPETRTSPSDSLHILQISQIADTLKAKPKLQLHCVGYSEKMISDVVTHETAWQRALRIRYTLTRFHDIEESRIFIYSQGAKKLENRMSECFLY